MTSTRGRGASVLALLFAGLLAGTPDAVAAPGGTRATTAIAAKAAKAAPAKPAPVKAQARRLEDIRIEGDVPVPQVIFVTARDPRRFMDFQHRRYLKDSRELGRETVFPSRVHLVGSVPAVIHKESAQ